MLAVFTHEVYGEVRTAKVNGEVMFVMKDVCKILDIKNSRDAYSRLDNDEKDSVGITDTIGRRRLVQAVNESGLYHLVFLSNKESAKQFRRWVTSEVLPEIRRNGRYDYPSWVKDEAEGQEIQRMVDQFNSVIPFREPISDEEWEKTVEGDKA